MANFPPTWLDQYFGSVVAPLGSGFLRFTNGVADASATLVSDADVAPNAAISGAKINPVFGTGPGGRISIDTSSGSGVAVRASAEALSLTVGLDDTVSSPGSTVFGGDLHITGQHARGSRGYGGPLYLSGGTSFCEAEGTGGNVYLSAGDGFDGQGEIQIYGRVVGNPSYQDPLAFGVTIKDTGGNTTVTLAGYEYNRLVIVLRGVLTANTDVIFPPISGYSKIVKNETTGGSFTLTARTLAGGGGVVIPRGAGRWVYCDDSTVLQLAA